MTLGGDTHIPLLVTNKHVIRDCEQIQVLCHAAEDGSPEKPSGKFDRCIIDLTRGGVIHHPSADVDLCAIPFASIIKQASAAGRTLLYIHLTEENLPSSTQWQNFDAIEEVLMIGCPNGLYDETNNLPIVRRGITATSIAKNYNGRPDFVVDMACFPGSSGSPVVIFNQSGYVDKVTNRYLIGESRFLLVGILYAGPMISNTGSIVLGSAPEFAVSTMMHLGYVLKSSHLIEIGDAARERFS